MAGLGFYPSPASNNAIPISGQKADAWDNASIDWMPVDHLSKLPGFVESVKLLLSTDAKVKKFNEHPPYQGHKFVKSKYLTTDWAKMTPYQKNKFAHMYNSTPTAWQTEAINFNNRRINDNSQQQQLHVTQSLGVSSSQLDSSVTSSSTSNDNTNQDDMARLCHMLADPSPAVKQMFVDLRSPIATRAQLDDRNRVRPEASLAVAFNNPQV